MNDTLEIIVLLLNSRHFDSKLIAQLIILLLLLLVE